MPSEVVLKCLSLRENRISIDLVRDEVEAELYKVHNNTIMLLVQSLTRFCAGIGIVGPHSEHTPLEDRWSI